MSNDSAIYEKWYKDHLKQRSGERRRRLEAGHAHAEKMFACDVWLPAVGHFEHLHPEYEIADYKDGTRFLDFAYIRYPIRLAVEIDGFWKNPSSVSRWKFSDTLMRQNHLILDGWRIIRFSYDDITEKPRMCQQLIQQFLGSWFESERTDSNRLNILESEVIRFILRSEKAASTTEIGEQLNMSTRRTRKLLKLMLEKQLLIPEGKGTTRIHNYNINKEYIGDRNIQMLI